MLTHDLVLGCALVEQLGDRDGDTCDSCQSICPHHRPNFQQQVFLIEEELNRVGAPYDDWGFNSRVCLKPELPPCRILRLWFECSQRSFSWRFCPQPALRSI